MAEYGEGGGAEAAAAGQLSYSEYLRLPQLLAIQAPLAEPPVHDEMLFVIVHQAHELWFKQILFELEALIDHINVADWQRACTTLDRMSVIVTLLVQHIGVLETMPAEEFQRFRRVLGSASGMQSDQFKHIEELSSRAPGVTASGLERAGAGAPSVRQAFLRALASGSELDGAAAANRTQPERLRSLYRDPRRAAEKGVAERLLHFDAQMAHWRARHLELVHSMIGATVGGTGGSSGVRYLQSTLDKRFFPELWAAREAQLVAVP